MLLHVLVDRGVHEHREDDGRGAVDGHRYGAGGRAQVEAGVQLLHVVQRGDVDAGVADLAVDVRARRRVFAVQRDRVERGGQARGGAALAEVMEAAVGALGRALAGEHAGGVLAAAAVRVHAAGVGVVAGQVFLAEEHELVAPAVGLRRRHLGDLLVAQRFAVVLHANQLVAHLVFVDVLGHRLAQLRPVAQQVDGLVAELLQRGVVALAQQQQGAVGGLPILRVQILAVVQLQRLRQPGVAQFLQRLVVVLRLAGGLGLVRDRGVDAAPLLGDLGQVAHAAAGDQHGGARLLQRGVELGPEIAARFSDSRFPIPDSQLVPHQAAQVHEHPGDAGVVELTGDGGVCGDVLVFHVERGAVALPLLAHVAQRVLGAALVEIVEHDQLGEVDHVDLLQLAGGAVVAGHHVGGEIDQVDDLRIALADAGGLDDDKVVGLALEEVDAVVQHGVGGRVLAAGGHRAHVDAMAAQRVHADAVAQQRTAGAAARGIDGEHGDAHVGEGVQEAQQQFVDHAGFAGAAGTGEAEHGRVLAGQLPLLAQAVEFGVGVAAAFQAGQHVADADLVVDVGRGVAGRLALGEARLAALLRAADHVLDHLHQAQLHAVVGVVDALHAVGFQLPDLFRGDGAAATAEHADMAGALLLEHVDHVLEVLDVAALVGRHGDRVGILLQRGAHHVLDRAVVAEVDHLRALGLDDPPHDVDRCVVAIEQAGRGDEPQWGGFRLRDAGGDVLGGGTHGNSGHRVLEPFDSSGSTAGTRGPGPRRSIQRQSARFGLPITRVPTSSPRTKASAAPITSGASSTRLWPRPCVVYSRAPEQYWA